MRIVSTQYSLSTNSYEIFVAGCKEHPCIGCNNPELWNPNIGDELTEEKYDELKFKISESIEIIDNFYILGGEPLEQPKEDVIKLIDFLAQFKKPIWLFTRFELKEIDKEILNKLDYVKTGKYTKSKETTKNIKYGVQLATSNQTIHKLK
jgi:anaerobic ribonucleoside-triphosphate reductase activating protein